MVTQWGPSAPTAAPPHFQPMSIVAKWSPISSTAELLLAKSESEIGKTRYVTVCQCGWRSRPGACCKSKTGLVNSYSIPTAPVQITSMSNHCKNNITSTQPTFLPWHFGLYQRPSSEEVCSFPLPVLATIVMRRGKKSVVRVAHCVAPLVPVQGLPSFFPNMYFLFDPSSSFVRFSVQNSGGWPVDHVVVLRCMISQCLFVLLRQTWCTLVSGERFAS